MSIPTDGFDWAMQLSEKDRAELAHQLLLSLEPHEEFEDSDVASAWAQEIDARLQKIATGNYQSHDWRNAIKDARDEIKKDAQP